MLVLAVFCCAWQFYLRISKIRLLYDSSGYIDLHFLRRVVSLYCNFVIFALVFSLLLFVTFLLLDFYL